MIKPTSELLAEVKEDLSEIIDSVESGTPEINYLLQEHLLNQLRVLQANLSTIQRRISDPVKQQSSFEEVKSYVKAGKLPPLDTVKTGIQYTNSNK